MKLLFKQRFFSWFDSYDIYNEDGAVMFTVKGRLSWGHLLKIYSPDGRELGMLKQRVLTWLPRFDMYIDGQYMGCISKELTLFRPKFDIDCNGWHVEGDWMGWDYSVIDRGKAVARMTKQLWNWTDTYVIDVYDPAHALCVLMIALAIDAEKCSGSN